MDLCFHLKVEATDFYMTSTPDFFMTSTPDFFVASTFRWKSRETLIVGRRTVHRRNGHIVHAQINHQLTAMMCEVIN